MTMQNLFPTILPRGLQQAMLSLAMVFVVGACVISPSLALAENNTSALADEFFAKGLEYFWAEDIPQHYEEAFVWLSKAAEYWHPRAQAMQADMLANGLGTVIDREKAFALANAAAESGDVFGRFLLGKYFYWGIGTASNEEQAKHIFSQMFFELEQQAESGDGLAQHGLGWMYATLSTVTKDYQKAHHWYEKAAIQGYAVAQNNLAIMFCNGEGVRQNARTKNLWYRRAAKQGYPIAQYNLALSLGAEGDLEGKYRLLLESADRNYKSAQAKLGWIFEEGKGQPVDLKSAVALYRKAAAQGHQWAQHHLGRLYQKGKGVPQDYHEAMKWYRVAAENGYASGMANVGHLFEAGLGVEKNYVEARSWYERGAEQGNTYSEARLGYLYMNGFGVDQDYDKATEWLQKASRGGNEWARYGMGLVHEKQRQYSQAIRWYLWAAIKGYDFGFRRAVYLVVMYPVSFWT